MTDYTTVEQIRAHAIAQANANASPGTPMKMIVAEAMIVEDYIRLGAGDEIKQLRKIRDQIDLRNLQDYISITTPGEDDSPGVVPMTVDDLNDIRAKAEEAHNG